jgi:preprotein translocase subunit SecY
MTSTESAWPRPAGFTIDRLAVFFRFASNPARLVHGLFVVLLVAVYIAGMFIPIPGAVRHAETQRHAWWFQSLLDSLITGGALGRGSIFCMGLLAPLLLVVRARFEWVLVRVLVGFTLVAFALSLILRMRGQISPGFRSWLVTALLIMLGGIAVKLINLGLARYHGPAPFYINLLVTIAYSLRASARELAHSHHYTPLYYLAGGIVFIGVTCVVMLRSRIRIEVQSLRKPSATPTTQMEIAPLNELLLDTIGVVGLMLYVCLSGTMSVVFNWHEITATNYPAFLAVSGIVFFLVWWMFAAVNRYRGMVRMASATGILNIVDPEEYALRMLNTFWIIPGVPAGLPTERFLSQRLSRFLRWSFVLLGSWLMVGIGIQYVAARSGLGMNALPYGPFVFVFTVFMLVGNLSMVTSSVGTSLKHFGQLLQGKSRVIADTFPLGSSAARRLILQGDQKAYWEEERLTGQFEEMVDWLKLAQQAYSTLPQKHRPKVGWAMHLQKWITSAAIGMVVAFVSAALCLLFVPDTSGRDLSYVIVPMVVTSLFAPDILLKVMGRIRLK